MKYINSTRHTGQNLTKNVSLFCQVLVWLFAKLCGSVCVAKRAKKLLYGGKLCTNYTTKTVTKSATE